MQSSLSGQRKGKRKHTCVSHAHTYTNQIYMCKFKKQNKKESKPRRHSDVHMSPSELFKCNIVKFEPVLDCGYSW